MLVSLIVVTLNLKSDDTSIQKYYLMEASEEKGKTLEYLLTYVLPLCAFDFTHWDGMVLYLIFFLTMCFLCVKHQIFLINIPLEIVGITAYNCVLKDISGREIKAIVLCRENLKLMIGENIKAKYINNQYMSSKK